MDDLGRVGAGPSERNQAQLTHLEHMTYDEICRTRVAFGSAPALIDRIGELRESLDLDGFIIEPNAGGLIPAPLALSLSKGWFERHRGFDRLSPNGGRGRASTPICTPFALSLSKG